MRQAASNFRRKKNRAGMTLIELVAAVAVLSIVTTELLVLRTRAMDISAKARNVRVAKELARLKMEEYLAYANNVPEQDSGRQLNIDPPDLEGEFESHPGFYWIFDEDTQDFDLLLPEEEEEEFADPEEEEEEDVERYMVIVTLRVYRQESEKSDPDVLIILNTLREETPEEAALNIP